MEDDENNQPPQSQRKKKRRQKKKRLKDDEIDSNENSSDDEKIRNQEKHKKLLEEKEKQRQEEKNLHKIVFQDRYEIQSTRLLGKGSFGEIYIAKDLQFHGNYVALKLESQKKAKQNQLKTEKQVLEAMANCEGFPKLFGYGSQNESNFLVMELLGPNLAELFEFCKKFTLQTVLLIGIQLLTRIQELHSKNYIHMDIKPENFLIGVESNSSIVYAIDFGLAKKYKDSKMDNIPYKENRPLTGTVRYASINNHLGIEQSRRDDLESIGYVLLYFLKKRLPWQGCQGSTKQERYNKILEKKLAMTTEVLCKDLPIEFSIYMNYVKNLKYNERPDYNFLKSLFFELLCYHYNEKFLFDWILENPFEDPPNIKQEKKKTNILNNQIPIQEENSEHKEERVFNEEEEDDANESEKTNENENNFDVQDMIPIINNFYENKTKDKKTKETKEKYGGFGDLKKRVDLKYSKTNPFNLNKRNTIITDPIKEDEMEDIYFKKLSNQN